jgi:hypothetical protein
MTTAVSSLMLTVPVVSGADNGATSLVLDATHASGSARSEHPGRSAISQEERLQGRSRGGVGGASKPTASTSGATESAAPAGSTQSGATPTGSTPSTTAAPSTSPGSGVTVDPGPDCSGAGRTVVRPVAPGSVLTTQWEAGSPGKDTTYDLSGVTSTAYPATKSPFAAGTATAAPRTCVVGGTISGRADEAQTWQVLHDEYNAACVKIIALEWMQVRGLRCDNVEDGIKPQESGVNANNARFVVSGTHLSRIRDDCMENDYTVGGLLHDSLWESCNTGISERPSADRSWPTPSSETLVLDRMLIGLYKTPHVEDGETVMGENALFKWSSSGNRVVIKCSVFKVDEVSLNGVDTMAMPPGTVVDDSACPDNPSTIVWLGGGEYPAWTAGMRVVSDPAVWTDAVRAWKSAHAAS